ncbi:hypothetical protein ABI59_23580 [Acidobacteria bacterium Mor1]|nr:hypothetical protein ABI59_23580 [Acidobacteria bacterium Mor1]
MPLRLALAGLLLLTATQIALAGPERLHRRPAAPERIEALEQEIRRLMAEARIPGLQAALIADGELRWSAGFGEKVAGSGDPVTAETVFEAASLTKPLFAYAVLRLAEEGVLDLQDRLVDLLSEETLTGVMGHGLDAEGFRRDRLEQIRVVHLLSHSAGTPHAPPGEIFPLAFDPGTSWAYSAFGYELLRLAVEARTGKPLVALIREQVLEPLGMEHSRMVWSDTFEATAARGHDILGASEDHRRRTRADASSSLYTTAADYGRFIAAFMNGKTLSAATLRKLMKQRVEVNAEQGIDWSLGFGMQQDRNGPAFWQWGDFGVFRNFALAYPLRRTALVYLTNSENGLSICAPMVTFALGGASGGCDHLNYPRYDSALRQLVWAVEGLPPAAVSATVEELRESYGGERIEQVLARAGYLLMERGRPAVAVELLKRDVALRPESADARGLLGRALLENGAWEPARRELALALAGAASPSELTWLLEYIRALEAPANLPQAYLARLAGDYETRHVALDGGRLYYRRRDAAAGAPRELIPLTPETFMLRGESSFRLRFEFDSDGAAARVVGLYEGGGRDASSRTPE